jgi:hypothetical protein
MQGAPCSQPQPSVEDILSHKRGAVRRQEQHRAMGVPADLEEHPGPGSKAAAVQGPGDQPQQARQQAKQAPLAQQAQQGQRQAQGRAGSSLEAPRGPGAEGALEQSLRESQRELAEDIPRQADQLIQQATGSRPPPTVSTAGAVGGEPRAAASSTKDAIGSAVAPVPAGPAGQEGQHGAKSGPPAAAGGVLSTQLEVHGGQLGLLGTQLSLGAQPEFKGDGVAEAGPGVGRAEQGSAVGGPPPVGPHAAHAAQGQQPQGQRAVLERGEFSEGPAVLGEELGMAVEEPQRAAEEQEAFPLPADQLGLGFGLEEPPSRGAEGGGEGAEAGVGASGPQGARPGELPAAKGPLEQGQGQQERGSLPWGGEGTRGAADTGSAQQAAAPGALQEKGQEQGLPGMGASGGGLLRREFEPGEEQGKGQGSPAAGAGESGSAAGAAGMAGTASNLSTAGSAPRSGPELELDLGPEWGGPGWSQELGEGGEGGGGLLASGPGAEGEGLGAPLGGDLEKGIGQGSSRGWGSAGAGGAPGAPGGKAAQAPESAWEEAPAPVEAQWPAAQE